MASPTSGTTSKPKPSSPSAAAKSTVTWKMADGKEQHVDYVIPNANQCLTRHSQDKRFLPIGLTGRNLNRPAPWPVAADFDVADEAGENQLAMLRPRQHARRPS